MHSTIEQSANTEEKATIDQVTDYLFEYMDQVTHDNANHKNMAVDSGEVTPGGVEEMKHQQTPTLVAESADTYVRKRRDTPRNTESEDIPDAPNGGVLEKAQEHSCYGLNCLKEITTDKEQILRLSIDSSDTKISNGFIATFEAVTSGVHIIGITSLFLNTVNIFET